jgi:CDP-diacylglycerol--glycerol-3-phosphate 3-phosphatidyltransferase
MVHCESVVLFELCLWIGLATRLEILAIVFTLKKWTNDVPTIYHAVKLRQGKEIKRNKLFNG